MKTPHPTAVEQTAPAQAANDPAVIHTANIDATGVTIDRTSDASRHNGLTDPDTQGRRALEQQAMAVASANFSDGGDTKAAEALLAAIRGNGSRVDIEAAMADTARAKAHEDPTIATTRSGDAVKRLNDGNAQTADTVVVENRDIGETKKGTPRETSGREAATVAQTDPFKLSPSDTPSPQHQRTHVVSVA